MITVMIIEDNRAHQGRLETALYEAAKELKTKICVHVAGNKKEAEERKKEGRHFQLYFIDLEIDGDRNMGFQLAKEIREEDPYVPIVFVTTLSEAMPLVFRHHIAALDFIGKDGEEEVFKEKVKDCLSYVKERESEAKRESIFSYSYEGRRGIRVPFRDILMIRTTERSHRLELICTNYLKEFYGSIAEITELDKEGLFYRLGRSVLVNPENIERVDEGKREIIFVEGTTCPISLLKIRSVRKMLEKRR